MKKINPVKIILILTVLTLFTVACDTELGHSHDGTDSHHENHDHDGDGIQGHTLEEHSVDDKIDQHHENSDHECDGTHNHTLEEHNAHHEDLPNIMD
jgi:hypothetical protein